MADRGRSFAPWAFVVAMGVMLSGCGAEPHTVVLTARAGTDQGGVLVAFSPTASSFDDEQADPQPSQPWQLWIDGQRALVDDGDGHVSPLAVSEGGLSAVGYLDAGPHHFTMAASGGAATFDGDAEVPSGGTVRLFLYGPPEALQGRFVATPDVPASGNEHVTVVNLLRTGQRLQVVTCTCAASCTPASSDLALGDLYDTEVPAASDGDGATMTTDGAGIGYRVTPSPTLPDPPVLALRRGSLTAGGPAEAASRAIFVAAPVYMSDTGQLLYGFN